MIFPIKHGNMTGIKIPIVKLSLIPKESPLKIVISGYILNSFR